MLKYLTYEASLRRPIQKSQSSRLVFQLWILFYFFTIYFFVFHKIKWLEKLLLLASDIGCPTKNMYCLRISQFVHSYVIVFE